MEVFPSIEITMDIAQMQRIAQEWMTFSQLSDSLLHSGGVSAGVWSENNKTAWERSVQTLGDQGLSHLVAGQFLDAHLRWIMNDPHTSSTGYICSVGSNGAMLGSPRFGQSCYGIFRDLFTGWSIFGIWLWPLWLQFIYLGHIVTKWNTFCVPGDSERIQGTVRTFILAEISGVTETESWSQIQSAGCFQVESTVGRDGEPEYTIVEYLGDNASRNARPTVAGDIALPLLGEEEGEMAVESMEGQWQQEMNLF